MEPYELARLHSGNISENEFFFMYYTKAYVNFLSGHDYTCARLEKKLAFTFERRLNDLSLSIERLEKRIFNFMTYLDYFPMIINNLSERKKNLILNNFRVDVDSSLREDVLKTISIKNSKRNINTDEKENNLSWLDVLIASMSKKSECYCASKLGKKLTLNCQECLKSLHLLKFKAILELFFSKLKAKTIDTINNVLLNWLKREKMFLKMKEEVYYDSGMKLRNYNTLFKLLEIKEIKQKDLTIQVYPDITTYREKVFARRVFSLANTKLDVLKTIKKWDEFKICKLETKLQNIKASTLKHT
eukprot:gnl/MRDRNA2_/MRDRNA2_85237_c0_seq2.p1 gnl/MRDRNA2_/MRDRNA2_85237_c0~~gnl/MRDRNA2_/MRDRNA2_85237_c0_seq2.p1  ORF type:complete len:302 (+),score=-1.78 gnl/MRDRNA2_/MRDRNA2_85237_c0_seq2:796-1701(+)